MTRRRSDRIAGLLLLSLALWYVVETRQFTTGFLSGPVGPHVLPILLGSLLGVLSLYLIFKPDPDPGWAAWPQWRSWAIVVASSFAYGYALVPLGFIVASCIEVTLIGYFFGGRLRWLIPSAVALAVVAALLFENVLGLPLPDGIYGI